MRLSVFGSFANVLCVLPIVLAGCSAAEEPANGEDVANSSDAIIKEVPPGQGVTIPPPGLGLEYVGLFHMKSQLDGKCLTILKSDIRTPRMATCLAADTNTQFQLFAIYKMKYSFFGGTVHEAYDICIPKTGTITYNEPLLAPDGTVLDREDVVHATCLIEPHTDISKNLGFYSNILTTRSSSDPNGDFTANSSTYEWKEPYINVGSGEFRLKNESNKVVKRAASNVTSQRWSFY